MHDKIYTLMQAAVAGRNGDKVAKKKYDQISGVLIVAGIVFQVIGLIIITASAWSIVNYYKYYISIISRET